MVRACAGAQNVVTFAIHLKTRRDGGSAAHGYPDDSFLERLASECAAAGVGVGGAE